MADKVAFELVSPEQLVMSIQADMVVVPGTEGDFGVLAGHAPLVSTIRPGVVNVYDEKNITRIFVRGGFAEVTQAGLTILVEEATDLATVDRASIEGRIRNAQEDVTDAKDEISSKRAKSTLEHLQMLRDAL